MDEQKDAATVPWNSGPSIPVELDYALNAICGYFNLTDLPDIYAALIHSVPQEWRSELNQFWGASKGFLSILEPAAYLAGSLLDEDYGRSTVAIRELTFQAALDRLQGKAADLGLAPDESLPADARLVELFVRITMATLRSAGFRESEIGLQEVQFRKQAQWCVRILREGDLNARFWHWMDRFYYEHYRPWRQAATDTLETNRKQAVAALGASQGTRLPDLTLLPPQNPLLVFPELQQAARSGLYRVYFWIEPFGLADSWAFYPDLLLVSVAKPGVLYEKFRETADHIAARAAALGDPTRLIILRMIRQFSLTNTDIASYLGISRPTVSIHAKILREAGLIRSTPQGRLVRHEIVPSEVRRFFQELENFLDLPEDQDTP